MKLQFDVDVIALSEIIIISIATRLLLVQELIKRKVELGTCQISINVSIIV